MTASSIAIIVAAALAGAAQPGALLEEFRGADRYGKMRVVSECVMGKRPAADPQIEELLLAFHPGP